ncbi:hypothetical protein B7P34_28225, partial [Streptosporangium nondiastaticum]
PADPSQQRVGEEVAAARALRDLSEQLLDKACRGPRGFRRPLPRRRAALPWPAVPVRGGGPGSVRRLRRGEPAPVASSAVRAAVGRPGRSVLHRLASNISRSVLALPS